MRLERAIAVLALAAQSSCTPSKPHPGERPTDNVTAKKQATVQNDASLANRHGTAANVPAVPIPPACKAPFVPELDEIKKGPRFRFAGQIEVALGIPALAESPELVDVRVLCSTRRFVRIVSDGSRVHGVIYERIRSPEGVAEGCKGPVVKVLDPVIAGAELCARELNTTTWPRLLARLEGAGIWNVRSRWTCGDPIGPHVTIKTKDRKGTMNVASISSYIGQEADKERTVVRVLNDTGLCSPRPPG